MVTDKLKQLIFKHLYKELGNVEIIPYNDSLWFIDRENSYWYFQLSKEGCLFWRYSFFPSFFSIFSLEQSEFEPIISSWVEEVLNHKVSTTNKALLWQNSQVEEVLNHKVSTTGEHGMVSYLLVEEVLNHKVSTTCHVEVRVPWKVGEVLNHKVPTTPLSAIRQRTSVEEVLNSKVSETFEIDSTQKRKVKKVLDSAWVKKTLNENPTE